MVGRGQTILPLLRSIEIPDINKHGAAGTIGSSLYISAATYLVGGHDTRAEVGKLEHDTTGTGSLCYQKVQYRPREMGLKYKLFLNLHLVDK